jgi:hypothetical protein
MNYSKASPKSGGAISSTEDIMPGLTYGELSMEFKKLYPMVSRAFHLIVLMYNRLTIDDKLSHKEAISKIYEDHKHLQGFSQRNIRRSLMSLENPNIPHRTSRKIRPTWPNSVESGASIEVVDRENAKLSSNSPMAEQDYESGKNLVRENECSNCHILLVQTQKLEKERSKVVEDYEQTLQIIKEQEQRISDLLESKSYSDQPVTDNDSVKVLEQEIALLYVPLQHAMASAFKLKENNMWLTIRFSKNTGNIIAVYTGRKSSQAYSSQSILSKVNSDVLG